jgi:hypothetical protein
MPLHREASLSGQQVKATGKPPNLQNGHKKIIRKREAHKQTVCKIVSRQAEQVLQR